MTHLVRDALLLAFWAKQWGKWIESPSFYMKIFKWPPSFNPSLTLVL